MKVEIEKKFSKSTSKKLVLSAFLIWTGWVFFYAVVMYIQIGEIPFWAALIASANYNYTYALLSILIWKICKKIPFENSHKLFFVLLHFVLAIFFSVLWLFIVYGSWYLAEGARIFEQVRIREIIGWQFLFGMVQYFLVAGIFYTVIYYRNLKQKEKNEAELKILTRDAELKALKLQMNPHFLFNSLNSINALVTKDATLTRKMISQLSELLRMSLESHDKLLIPLKEELDLVHTYLSIEQMRFGGKMIVQEDVDPGLLTKSFPAMLLQPLLENAVKHGIANTRTGGTIKLSIHQAGQWINGTVTNETSDENLQSKKIKNGNGMSLKNICQRLDRMYGNNYRWQVDSTDKNQFKIEFEIPLMD